MPVWEWVLADAAGTILTTLQSASGRSISWTRNAAPEAKFSIAHEDDEAYLLLAALANGVPQLRAYRDDVLRFSGYLDALDESGDTDASTIGATFRGPFARLVASGASGGRYTGSAVTFTQTDAGEIAWSLIDTTNGDSDTGIRRGAIEATMRRDRTYEVKSIGDAISELTTVIGGFDFEVAPLDPTLAGGKLGEFNVYRAQGRDRPEAHFEYGPETARPVSGVRRTTTPPVNRVRALGANGLISEVSDAASIDRFGLYERTLSATDVVEQATLDGQARAALRPGFVQVVSFTPDPRLSPDPWADYWLGDTVRFHAAKDAFVADLSPRVNGFAVTLGDQGEESGHALTIDTGQAA